jgi:peptidoglycan/xylan/chitin deacetylase (PgdA/CDA1 family)
MPAMLRDRVQERKRPLWRSTADSRDTDKRGALINLKLIVALGVFVGAICFALVRTGAIGGNDGNDIKIGPGAAAITDPSSASPSLAATLSPSPTESPPPGTPMAGPVDVPIMMYHIIGPPDRPENDALAVSESDFNAQMSYLACAGYTPITVQRLFDAFHGTAALPDKPIILTFDDGWVGQYTYGVPVLEEQGFVGSFAIVTGFVEGGGPYMTWAQIQELSNAGMEIMSHTVNHIDLGTSSDATDLDELTRSKADLEAHTGRAIRYFVYPSGEPFRSGSEERQAAVVQMLSDTGYRGALLDDNGYGGEDPARPYELSRVRVSGGEDIATFAGSIYGPSPDSLGCQ